MKVLTMFMAAGLLVVVLAACGNQSRTNTDQDAAGLNSSMDTAMMTPDTAPAAVPPAGAINPAEDSARFGTGAGDTSKTRRP